MIELKEITKVYNSKKGTSTEALRGINLTFSEKGLTFILGKSGSGKSTLLNILGGLDSFTSGDIFVNGKSTKDFKESEWDAYRNTYMGFVFQEFNLLDNYSVEENIKLSLELQGKPCQEEDIFNALKMVDLENILKRKPNELSGGQKQRVAIARALIKNPEIILADEPTGNLDSTTSEQIFNILKKLSKDKLVIIVSHNEEAAQKYADRIIKISDGLVIEDTNPPKKTINKEFKLVNAKLPFGYSLKMGLGNLLHKKIKLLFSFISIVLCLICFGLMTSVLNTNLESEYLNIFEENENTEMQIVKYEDKVVNEKILKEEIKHIFDNSYESWYPDTVPLNDDFITEVQNNTNLKWYGMYTVYNNYDMLSWNYINTADFEDNLYYYIGSTLSSEFINIMKANSEFLDDENIIGTFPTNEDEIMITSFIADQIIYNGILSKSNKNSNTAENYKPDNYNQIINDDIYINLGDMIYVKVVGIVDYSTYLQKYDLLMTTKTSTFWDMLNYKSDGYEKVDKQYTDIINDTEFLNRVYVHDLFITNLEEKEENMSNSATRIVYNNNSFPVDTFGYINNNLNIYSNNGINTISNLNNNEIIINTTLLDIITNNDYSNKLMEMNNELSDVSQFLPIYLNDNNIIGMTVKTSINDNNIYNDTNNFDEYKIVGVVDDSNEASLIYYNENVVKDLISDNIEMGSIVTKVNTKEELLTIFEYYPLDNSDVLSTNLKTTNLLSSLYISTLFKVIGPYGTVFFLIFAIIILMNYISNGIKFRRKEIGILRALGCRGVDVIKMFLCECLTLMIICLSVSFIIIPIFANSINNFISEQLYININVMNFGVVQVIGVTSIMIIIVILASVIPIHKLTKIKPIDTILDK